MNKTILMAVFAVLLVGGCATGGVSLDPGNSPSSCARNEALGRVPPAQLHDYMQHCTAGYQAGKSSDGKAFKMDLPASNQSSG